MSNATGKEVADRIGPAGIYAVQQYYALTNVPTDMLPYTAAFDVMRESVSKKIGQEVTHRELWLLLCYYLRKSGQLPKLTNRKR